MKIALSTSGNDLSAPLDPRFGRAARFLVYDTESNTFKLAGNEQNLNAAQGAGIQSAQNAASTGAKAVISGHFGPKAFRVLNASNIAMYTSTGTTVQDALDLYAAGELTAAQQADVEGHWI